MKGIPHVLVMPYVRQLWRHKWMSIAIIWSICAIGWGAIGIIPAKYESSTRVYVNADQLLTPILNGVAVNDDPTRQVEYLQRTLLSRPNLEQVIHLSDLDLASEQGANPATREEALQKLAREVVIRPQTANLMTITYRNADPTIAKNVVSALLTVFSENSTGNNRSEMENAKRFLNQEIEGYEKQLRGAETRRAEFHQKYIDLLPGLDGAASRLDVGRALIAKLQLEVADATARRDSLQHELDSVPKLLSVDASSPQVIVSGKPVDVRAELQEARSRLLDLQTRFTDAYPDVISLKQQIAALEDRIAKESPTSNIGAGRKNEIANPVYEQIKIRVVEVQTTLDSTERALKQARDEQVVLEKKALDTPGIVAQAQALDRDYEAKKKSYEELAQRREQTLIGEAADTTAEKIQFRVIDAPQVPVIPAAPNKPLYLLAVFVIAFGAAVAAPLALFQFDKSFSTISAVRALGVPVLGSVSRLMFPTARRRIRFQIATLCASAGALVMIFGVLLVLSINVYGLGVSL